MAMRPMSWMRYNNLWKRLRQTMRAEDYYLMRSGVNVCVPARGIFFDLFFLTGVESVLEGDGVNSLNNILPLPYLGGSVENDGSGVPNFSTGRGVFSISWGGRGEIGVPFFGEREGLSKLISHFPFWGTVTFVFKKFFCGRVPR